MAIFDAVIVLELTKEELDLVIHMAVLGITGLGLEDKKEARDLILRFQKILKESTNA